MKLHILGASGSGVTTLGLAMACKLNITYFDSDNYFWKNTDPPFTERQNPGKRNSQIIADLGKFEDWILGGSIFDWGDNLFPTFDVIVFLYVPQNIRIERLIRREFEKYGSQIYSVPGKAEKFENFIHWAADYDNNSGIANRTLQAHENWLTKSNSKILRLVGDLTTEEKMQLILDLLKDEKIL